MRRSTLLNSLRAAAIIPVLGLAGGLLPTAAHAQDTVCASNTIKLVVPFGPGGPPDVIARVIAQGLENDLKKTVVVENMPGGSTAIAARAVARAKPDGCTLLAVDISFTVASHVTPGYGLDPQKDFTPIGMTARSPLSFLVSSKVPAKDLGAFIKLAREKPNELTIGHSGVGTTPHLAALSFINSAGVDLRLVPYRQIRDAMTNAMSGVISGVFSAAGSAISVKDSSNMRVLALTGDARLPQLPDVPTFAEQGVEMRGLENGSWFGLVAPAGTPAGIVNRLSQALAKAAQDERAQERLSASGTRLAVTDPESFRRLFADQNRFWLERLKAVGFN